jgi:hypothetical protein
MKLCPEALKPSRNKVAQCYKRLNLAKFTFLTTKVSASTSRLWPQTGEMLQVVPEIGVYATEVS